MVLDTTAVEGLKCDVLWPLHSSATGQDALARESITRFREKVRALPVMVLGSNIARKVG
jgi:hypothetical protein